MTNTLTRGASLSPWTATMDSQTALHAICSGAGKLFDALRKWSAIGFFQSLARYRTLPFTRLDARD
jgi:hypothetical protein